MPKAAPPPLSSHLSYKSALVLLPPASVRPLIDVIREKHDRNFHRWPPHINLIYPFLAHPTQARESIRHRIAQALDKYGALQIQIKNANYFRHSRSSATVYLEPVKPQCAVALAGLQARLQSEFAECDADRRDFTPHLSVGQARGSREIDALVETLSISMPGTDAADAPLSGESRPTTWSLEWTADRVCVLERHGFHGRFQVVDEIILPMAIGQL